MYVCMAQREQRNKFIMLSKLRAAKAGHTPSVIRLLSRTLFTTLHTVGVLHDGRNPYLDAIQACELAHASGLSLFIISNSSRRASGSL